MLETGYRATGSCGTTYDLDERRHEAVFEFPHEVLDNYRTDWDAAASTAHSPGRCRPCCGNTSSSGSDGVDYPQRPTARALRFAPYVVIAGALTEVGERASLFFRPSMA